jgi:PAS domain S-box-containing protein
MRSLSRAAVKDLAAPQLGGSHDWSNMKDLDRAPSTATRGDTQLITENLSDLAPNTVLNAVLATSNDCIKILDLDGRLLFMSEGGKRVMEVQDFSAIRLCPWADFWKGEGRQAAEQAIISAREGRTARFSAMADTMAGNAKFWDVEVIPLGGENGKPAYLLSISRDVTDLKTADVEIERLLEEARQNEVRFRTLADSMPQVVWSTLPDGYHDYYNARWYEFTGMPEGSTDGEGWNNLFHPDDQERAWAVWRASLASGAPYEIEYRLRHHSGEYRWVLGRALAMYGADGNIVRWYGTCTDIHAAKELSESLALLSHELSHRIKNIFAIINGLIGLSARRFPESRQFAIEIQQRLAALGRAHDFARPHSEDSRPVAGDTMLFDLLREILKPYPALDEGRIHMQGKEIKIDDRSATPFALIFHELATNASKYGALASQRGAIEIIAQVETDQCRIDWIEQGGPAINGVPSKEGFGTKLAAISSESQLGGSIARQWLPEGLKVTLRCPLTSLRRS